MKPLYTSVIVLALFSVGTAISRNGFVEGDLAEGFGTGIAVLLLSCTGLLYTENRRIGFMIAAVAFSLIMIAAKSYVASIR